MRKASTQRGLATLLIMAMLSAQAPALAQTDDDRAGARAAATAGSTAMQQEKWAEAIDLFTRAESLVHAPPHLLYIARAHAKLGKLVRARENYLKVMREELPATAPRAFVEAQASANAEGSALEARLPTVKVVVEGDNTEGSIVTMDGVPVASALTGVPHPIDPGEHKFQARTKSWSSEEISMTFMEGSRETLTLALKLTLRLTPEPTVVPVVVGPTGQPQTKETPATATEGLSTVRLGAYIGLGVGVVGVALGTVFLLRNRSKRNDADALCPQGVCPPSVKTQVRSLDSSAGGAATLAWVGYGVGIAGLGAGATLFVLSMRAKKKTETAGVTIQPWFGVNSAGMSGSF